MFSPRSKFQFAAVCITLFSLLAWFHSSHARHSVFEQRVGSRYIRYGGSSVALPDFNSVQAKVDIDEPADDPIWDTQNRTLGVRNICVTYIDWSPDINQSFKKFMQFPCHTARTKGIILHSWLWSQISMSNLRMASMGQKCTPKHSHL